MLKKSVEKCVENKDTFRDPEKKGSRKKICFCVLCGFFLLCVFCVIFTLYSYFSVENCVKYIHEKIKKRRFCGIYCNDHIYICCCCSLRSQQHFFCLFFVTAVFPWKQAGNSVCILPGKHQTLF